MLNLIIAIACAYFAKRNFDAGDNFSGWLNLAISAANAAFFMVVLTLPAV
jgi:uncharacterized protein (UPF0333 family)